MSGGTDELSTVGSLKRLLATCHDDWPVSLSARTSGRVGGAASLDVHVFAEAGPERVTLLTFEARDR